MMYPDGKREVRMELDLEAAYRSEGKQIAKEYEKNITLGMIDNEWKEHLRIKISEYEQWYYNTLLPLKSSKQLQEYCKNVFDNRLSIIKNALEETVDFDVNWYMGYLTKLDKERNTDFKKTFPELQHHTGERL